MRTALGSSLLSEVRRLAEVHRDGWGIVAVGAAGRSCYLSNESAFYDEAMFDALTSRTLVSALIHERLASPGIALNLDNQQPFAFSGIAFAHNGTIGDDAGNIVNRPAPYRESLGISRSSTMSDSRLFADLFYSRLIARVPGGDVAVASAEDARTAVAETIGLLRNDYPDASYNCIVQTARFTVVTRAHAEAPKFSDALRKLYADAGWADRLPSYFTILYATVTHDDGSKTSVASSSGYAASDSWTELRNGHSLILPHNGDAPLVLPLSR